MGARDPRLRRVPGVREVRRTQPNARLGTVPVWKWAIEIIVKPGANLRYVNLQNWNNKVWHFAHQKAIVERDASLQWTIGAMGGRLAKVNQHVALVGPGATSQVNGVMFTEGRQRCSCSSSRAPQPAGSGVFYPPLREGEMKCS